MTSPAPDNNVRRAGILLHPTSLPSGMLDRDVERWLQLIADSGFSVWQVLPLGEPQVGLSPYQCSSAFAMNPALLPELPPIDDLDTAFTEFCRDHEFWLDDYALFKILKVHFNGASWFDWPDAWKYRDMQALQQTRDQYARAITVLKWQQYQIHQRWQDIRMKAADKGILLFGDMPIFVGHDSTDVWAHPEWFLLNDDGSMNVVTGVPPDYFSETGQRWGNPHYNWDAMQESGFQWWHSRIDHYLDQFDLLRIDHFRGLEAVWMIDAACETAVDGHWEKVPGDALLSSFIDGLEHLPFVAEDLGIITAEVTALRIKYQLPGMSILQFGFDEFEDNPHKPHNIVQDNITYTGTHDNDTTRGWFDSLEDHVKNQVLQSLGLLNEHCHSWHDLPDAGRVVVDALVTQAMNSMAELCMLPMQDWLQLGSEARMNTPGTVSGNWNWQFQWEQLNPEHIDKMRLIIEKSQRLVNEQ
jgi:4-alpha-glucanotransferase